MGKIFERKVLWITAGAAVIQKNRRMSGGFTLMEVMVVVILIGILASLAYASLIELISTNRAKETAQTLRTFAERALNEGKRQNKNVTIAVIGKEIQYTPEGSGSVTIKEPLGNGFSASSTEPAPTCESGTLNRFNNGADSQLKIGISSIALKGDPAKTEGYFIACDARGYCGAAVKVNSKNFFVACIKRKNGWEAL